MESINHANQLYTKFPSNNFSAPSTGRAQSGYMYIHKLKEISI